MIATGLFPAFSALPMHGSQDFVAGQRRSRTIAVLLGFSVFPQGDQRLNRSILGRIRPGLEHLGLVIAPIPTQRADGRLDLPQQRDHLGGIILAVRRQGVRHYLPGDWTKPSVGRKPKG